MKTRIIILLCVSAVFSSCNPIGEPAKSQIKAVTVYDFSQFSDSLLAAHPWWKGFTGDDIKWFNPKTREIRFKNIGPAPDVFFEETPIEVRVGGVKVFTIIATSSSCSKMFNAAILHYDDIETNSYFLYNVYLPYQYPEEIQETAEERAKGWDIFLKQLKKERRLK